MRNAILVAFALTLARWPMAALLGLAPDEAYYWLWAQRPALSYFDHPPMVAWLIAGATAVFGDAAWAVRLPALLSGLVIPIALARAAWELAPDDGGTGTGTSRRDSAALATALLAGVMPLLHAGSVIVTPDSPAAAFWAVSLAALAVARNGRHGAWYLAGAALGAAMLSKYTAVLLGGSMVLALPFDAKLRASLRTPHPWIAGLLAWAIFSPVVLWNARHEWVSFAFQLGHGTAAGRGGVGTFLEFLGAQVGLLTPTLALLVGIHLVRGGNAADRDDDRFLAATILPTFALFAVLSLKSRPEANWPAFAYLGAAVVGGLAMARATVLPAPVEPVRWQAGLYRVTVLLGAVASLLVSVHALHPLVQLPKDRLRREFHGWKERAELARAAAGPEGWILADSYRAAAEMAYYGGSVERVGVARRPGERRSMFDLWGLGLPASEALRGADAVYVSPRRRAVPEEWAAAFESVAPLGMREGVTGTLASLQNCRQPPGRPAASAGVAEGLGEDAPVPSHEPREEAR